MRLRDALLLCAVSVLGGCMPRVPQIDLSGMTLPKMEIFRYGVADPQVPTTPYQLTSQNVIDVKTSFLNAFTDGRTLEFGPIAARRKADGSLAICGLVSIRDRAQGQTGMRLFDGSGTIDEFGMLAFRPSRLANVNGKALDIYSDCRDLGVL